MSGPTRDLAFPGSPIQVLWSAPPRNVVPLVPRLPRCVPLFQSGSCLRAVTTPQLHVGPVVALAANAGRPLVGPTDAAVIHEPQPPNFTMANLAQQRYVLLPGLVDPGIRQSLLAEAEALAGSAWKNIFNDERPMPAPATYGPPGARPCRPCPCQFISV